MEKLQLSVTILLTGLVVVFVLLFLLIIAIKIYSTLVYNAQNKKAKKVKASNVSDDKEQIQATAIDAAPDTDYTDSSISDELIAVIAAAVNAMYPQKSCTVKSVKRAKNTHSAWSAAGLIDGTRPF